MSNPRYANGSRRRKVRQWVLATQDICALCGAIVDKTLPAGHPMSAEVDEIIPVSKGGSPYERDNVQLAHRACNQRKGNKIINKGKMPVQSIGIKHSRQW